MKHKNIIIVLFIAFIGLSAASPSSHRVKYVFDGDTILLETGEHVRYIGIDAPEMGHDGRPDEFLARESMAFNRSTVRGSLVSLESDLEKQDGYGRLLAYVFTAKGEMVNALLVRKGLARVMVVGSNLKYFSLLRDHQRLAITEKIGLWGRTPQRVEPYYLGNRNSYRFHRPSCPLARKLSGHHLIRFETSRSAYWEGFSPCKQCRP